MPLVLPGAAIRANQAILLQDELQLGLAGLNRAVTRLYFQ